ncbi:MAG: TolC family protein [Gammaproteobacteria bacterium]|nr:TolC family protein [Gammaproteobacteria bacterium]
MAMGNSSRARTGPTREAGSLTEAGRPRRSVPWPKPLEWNATRLGVRAIVKRQRMARAPTLATCPLVLVVCLSGACSLVPPSPDAHEPVAPSGPVGAATDLPEPTRWWESFEDPALDRVMEATIDSNFDLAGAVARVEQARARARIAVGARLPMISASLGADSFDVPANAGLGAQLGELGIDSGVFDAFNLTLPDRLDLTTYSLGANFAYEADFWGRKSHAARAAAAEHLAAEADFHAARIGVLAETVRTYLEVVDLRRQRDLTADLVGILEEQEVLAEVRYERGLTEIDHLYEARRAVVDAQTQLPRITGRLADAEGRLWVVLGGYREDVEQGLPDALPAVGPASVPSDVPASLLLQRPDVGAARERVQAARYLVGARRAELLPSLSLSGSIGVLSTDTGEWFDADQWFSNLTVNLLGPVFEGGRRRGNVALAEARLDEAAAAFGRAVVTATSEVRASLTGLSSSATVVSLLGAAADEAAAEATLQEQRYVSGVGDYATFLAASRNHIVWQSALAAGRRDLGYARLALHRALGGTSTPHADARATLGTPSSPTPTRSDSP